MGKMISLIVGAVGGFYLGWTLGFLGCLLALPLGVACGVAGPYLDGDI